MAGNFSVTPWWKHREWFGVSVREHRRQRKETKKRTVLARQVSARDLKMKRRAFAFKQREVAAR
jgi:hypothetical protein